MIKVFYDLSFDHVVRIWIIYGKQQEDGLKWMYRRFSKITSYLFESTIKSAKWKFFLSEEWKNGEFSFANQKNSKWEYSIIDQRKKNTEIVAYCE